MGWLKKIHVGGLLTLGKKNLSEWLRAEECPAPTPLPPYRCKLLLR